MKIESPIRKSNNDGKIDEDFQAAVINAISSTSSDQILFITFEIWLGGGITYILLSQWKEKAYFEPSKPKVQNIYLQSLAGLKEYLEVNISTFRRNGNCSITHAKV